ncbi:hypothetical protein JCM17823_02020 [Halorubrum gandharaense]
MTGFYTFSPAIFHACHLVQPSDRGEYELPDAIDLLIQSGRTIDAIQLDGWRSRGLASGTSGDAVTRWIDVGFPEDRERAAERLAELEGEESDDGEDAKESDGEDDEEAAEADDGATAER